MGGALPPASAYVCQVPHQELLNLKDMKKKYDECQEHHNGLSLVVKIHLQDEKFLAEILEEQRLIKDIFIKHYLEEFLTLYEKEQLHGTVIELVTEHQKPENNEQPLSNYELTHSHKEHRKETKINYAVEWINKTQPFDVKIGPGVLKEENKSHIIRIAPNGQILMKGRATEAGKEEFNFLSQVRGEFEDEAKIEFKYGRTDDEFFIVIGYLKDSEKLNDRYFLQELNSHLESRRSVIQSSMKVTEVSAVLYKRRTLHPSECTQWNFKLGEEPPIRNLIQLVTEESKKLFGNKTMKTDTEENI